MISASNYLDVYTTCQLRKLFLIKDKLYERKTKDIERGNGGSQQTDAPCKGTILHPPFLLH